MIYLFGAFYALAVLWPYLTTGLYGPDAVRYASDDLLNFRVAQIGLLLTNLGLFGAFVRQVTRSGTMGLLAASLVLPLIQLREVNDPVASQSLAIGISIALGWGCLMGGLKLFSSRRAISSGKLAVVIVSAGAATLLLAFVLPGASGTSYLRQFAAAFPFSYALSEEVGFFSWARLRYPPVFSFFTFFLLVVGCAYFYLVLDRLRAKLPSSGARATPAALGWVAGFALFVPAFLVACLSTEHAPGAAAPVVYVSIFGVAIVLCGILGRVLAFRPTVPLTTGLAFLLSITVALSSSLNRIAADELNRYWKHPRHALEEAAARRLFSDVPPGATVLFPGGYAWATPKYLREILGLELNFVPIEQADEQSLGSPQYYLRFEALDGELAFVVLAPLMTGKAGKTGESWVTRQAVAVFVFSKNDTRSLRVVGEKGPAARKQPFVAELKDQPGEWKTIRLPALEAEEYDLESLGLELHSFGKGDSEKSQPSPEHPTGGLDQ